MAAIIRRSTKVLTFLTDLATEVTMKYDFETLIPRYNKGSFKWDGMAKIYADLPEDVIPLSVADMEFKNAPEIVDGLKEYLDTTILGYTGPTETYFDAVIGFMERHHGFSPKKEWFMEFSGIVPALRQIVGALLTKEDSVLIMTPVYHQFRQVVEHNGCGIVESELIEKDDVYTIDFADFEAKAARADVKLCILCSPHNPVGRVWTREELTEIADICLRNGVYLISDEIHSDLIMPGYEHVSVLSLDEKYVGNCLVCTSPGKTFNLAGMQASNIFVPSEAIRAKITAFRGHHSLNALSYQAVIAAYTKAEGWMAEMVDYVNENKKFVVDYLAKNLPLIKTAEMEGTYLLWMDYRAYGWTEEEQDTLLRDKAYLFLDPGTMFGKGGEGFARWNLACPRRYLAAALERMKKAIDEHTK